MNAHTTLVGLGEVLWDVFPSGPRFGGAPANFACSAAGLARANTQAFMVSRVGRDDLGERAVQALREHNVDVSRMQLGTKPTGQVLISLDDDGVASYEFAADTAWDNLQWNEDLQELAAITDVVCFGTLGQRSELARTTIQHFVTATRPTARRIFDINLRPPFYSHRVIRASLELANVLKLNEDELPVVASLDALQGNEIELLQQIAQRFDLQAVALTRGSAGALLLRDGEVSECAGITTDVVDTVGAGDAFTAAFALGLLEEADLDAINQRACRVAAFVCSQAGATPPLPAELTQDTE